MCSALPVVALVFLETVGLTVENQSLFVFQVIRHQLAASGWLLPRYDRYSLLDVLSGHRKVYQS